MADNICWTWTAKVRPNTYQWTRLSFSEDNLNEKWVPKEFYGLKPLGAMSIADMTWRLVKHPAGKGHFLTGDATAVLDPASSHGILKAIMSGMMAGHSIGLFLVLVSIVLMLITYIKENPSKFSEGIVFATGLNDGDLYTFNRVK